MAPATDTLTSATDRPTLEREVPDEIRTETIEGTQCTDRAGVAAITGLSLASINLKAGNDPDFPAPAGGARINRTYWYPVEKVRAYAELLAERAAAGKPRPVAEGDPDDLLDPKDAAEALGISDGTFSRYVNDSRPYWDGTVDGRPILPKPDVITIEPVGNLGDLERRQWYRRTLAEHQQTRPGRRANAGDGRTGRPRKS